MITDIIKVFFPAIVAFTVGVLTTPTLTHYLYKYKMWKIVGGKKAYDGNDAVVFNGLHKEKEVGTPKLGGIIIWFSAFFATFFIWFLSRYFDGPILTKLDFLSRNQTWIPLSAMILGAIVGAIDDYLDVKGNGGHFAGGLSLKKRLVVVSLIGLFCGFWFFDKLDIVAIGLPFGNEIYLGALFVPLFVLVMLFIYSGGVIDGLDGLAGGTFAVMFSSYSVIAFFQSQINLAAFCAAVVGGILAFLWFNIPPARFYMSETGTMALTVTLTIVAFMTDSLADGYGLLVLPIIAIPLVATTLSDVIQIFSKKYFKKKVFRIAPLHHHFEALGWPSYKVTMRYWILSLIFGMIGVILALIG